jgi:hypothetical protein
VVPREALSSASRVEDVDLVGEVEIGRGFVEQEQVRMLRQRHRDPHPLALAPGEFVDEAIGEVDRPGEV